MVQLHAGPPLSRALHSLEFRARGQLRQTVSRTWRSLNGNRGRSSVGRAPGLQPGGRRFESVRLHHPLPASWQLPVAGVSTARSHPVRNNVKSTWLRPSAFFENQDGLGTQVVERRASNIVLSVVKLQSVHGGCLGVQSRRRTWHSCEKPREAVKQALIRGSPRLGNQAGFISRRRESVGNAGN